MATSQPNLGLSLDASHNAPLYLQLFEQIADRIRGGAWPAGFRLPPSRWLAGELGTHRNTVVRAYEELTAAGYLDAVVGRGTFVAAQPEARVAAAAPSRPALPWQTLLSRASDAEPLGRLLRYRRDRLQQPSDSIDLARMQPAPELLPHVWLRRCLDHVTRKLGPRALGYAPPEGIACLREQIAETLAQSGVPAAARDIIITTGSQQALDLLARALIDPGDRFLVDSATYTGALNLLAIAEAQVVAVPSDDEGPDLASLERLARSGAKGLYLMPNCHNPTGRSISEARRHALVRWSHSAGVPLIEDDYGADLELDDDTPLPHLRALDQNVLYLSTFSKKLIPALRIGFIVCPEPLRESLAALKHAMDLGTSPLLQYALAEMLERGYLDAHYRTVLPEYRQRRDALDIALRRHLPSEIHWERPRRGVVMWLELPPEIDPDDVYKTARSEGVLVTPGALHAVSDRHVHGIRLAFCYEPTPRLLEGAKRLGKAMRKVLARARKRPPAVAGVAYGV